MKIDVIVFSVCASIAFTIKGLHDVHRYLFSMVIQFSESKQLNTHRDSLLLNFAKNYRRL